MNKKVRKFILSMIVSAFVIAGFWTVNKSSASGAGESAGGHGTFIVQDENGKNVRRQFSFNARRNADGKVTGHAILHNLAFNGANGHAYQASFDISCMKVYGNFAVLGGFVRRTNDPNLVDAAYFAVQDNGEPGKNNDRISSVFFNDDDPTTTGDPGFCEILDPANFGTLPIDAGNIQVRQ